MSASIALCFFLFSVFSVSRAEVCVSPRIKRASACGIVIDPYGMFVPNARVVIGTQGSSLSTATDGRGKFSAAAQGSEIHLQISAPGFKTVETTVGRLKMPAEPCKKPLFVMLTIEEQGCAMVSLRKSDLLLAKKE